MKARKLVSLAAMFGLLATVTQGALTPLTSAQSGAAPTAPAVTSASTCTTLTPGYSYPNNSGGTIRIASGTGSFASVSDASDTITVAPGAPITGQVDLEVTNAGRSDAVAPLIATPSWGNAQASYWTISPWIGTGGTFRFPTTVALTAPASPGTYHIVFAFQLEETGGNVASGSSWFLSVGTPSLDTNDVWSDGNDVAEFTSTQINSAQQFGCAYDYWLVSTGGYPGPSTGQAYSLVLVPSDAITVVVAASPIPATITTLASPTGTKVAPGTATTDTATVTGSTDGPTPTGTVTFDICGPSLTVKTPGCTIAAGTEVASVRLNSSGEATSPDFTATTAPGSYCWAAAYSGDRTYTSTKDNPTSNTASECFTVIQPFTIAVVPSDRTLTVTSLTHLAITIRPAPSYTGPVVLSVQDIPHGITPTFVLNGTTLATASNGAGTWTAVVPNVSTSTLVDLQLQSWTSAMVGQFKLTVSGSLPSSLGRVSQTVSLNVADLVGMVNSGVISSFDVTNSTLKNGQRVPVPCAKPIVLSFHGVRSSGTATARSSRAPATVGEPRNAQCFSIQQNAVVYSPSQHQEYFVQNAIYIVRMPRGTIYAKPGYEVFSLPSYTVEACSACPWGSLGYKKVSLPYNFALSLSILGGSLNLTSSLSSPTFGTFRFSVPSDSYIVANAGSQIPPPTGPASELSDAQPPEIFVTGAGNGTDAWFSSIRGQINTSNAVISPPNLVELTSLVGLVTSESESLERVQNVAVTPATESGGPWYLSLASGVDDQCVQFVPEGDVIIGNP